MPVRLLREGILTSERVNQLTWPAEVFYRRLMSVVDDYGRYYASPTLLRASCYPLAIDTVSDKQVADWLIECVNAGLLLAYEVAGKRYLEILDFRQQVRAKASKFPADPSTCKADANQPLTDAKQMLATAHLDEDEDEDVSDASDTKKALPKDWQPNEKEIDYFNSRCKQAGLTLEETVEDFKDYWAKTGRRYVDWTATWQTWCRKAVKIKTDEINTKGLQASSLPRGLIK